MAREKSWARLLQVRVKNRGCTLVVSVVTVTLAFTAETAMTEVRVEEHRWICG